MATPEKPTPLAAAQHAATTTLTRQTMPEPAPEPGPPVSDEKLGKLLQAKGADGLLARYLEQHGSWSVHAHRDHAGARQLRVLAYCGCPICVDARAHLKLED